MEHRWEAFAGAVTGYAHSASGLGINPAASAKRLLDQCDKNGDGKLEPSEGGATRWEHLKVADADGDGKVTLDEIERAIESGTLTGPVDDE